MAVNTMLGSLNGLFKEVWSKELQDVVPDHVKALNLIPFSEKDPVGRKYHVGVILGLEHGITFAPAGEDGFSLEAPIPGTTKDAEIVGSSCVIRAQIGANAAARAVKSEAAYKSATKFVIENMHKSITKKLEIEMFYGQMGYAVVESVTGSGPYVLTIKAKEWSPAIWAGGEKMPLELVRAGSIVTSGMVVTKVDFKNKQVTVTSGSAPLAEDVLFHKTANKGDHEFAGFQKIITTSGSLFGIDNTEYGLWKGNEVDQDDKDLSLFSIEQAIASAVEKGLDSDVKAFVNPKVWGALLSDQAALRKYDSSYKAEKMENGAKSIMFYGQCGSIEVIPHTYVKEGHCFILNLEDFHRIGSTDVTFKRLGADGEQFFQEVPNAHAYEIRAFADFALLSTAPGRQTLISNIKTPVE